MFDSQGPACGASNAPSQRLCGSCGAGVGESNIETNSTYAGWASLWDQRLFKESVLDP